MKILITTDWYRPVINGVVTSVLNLTEQLEKRGHEVKVLTLSRNCHSYKEENVIYMMRRWLVEYRFYVEKMTA